jgi:long-subunit fatty acid transport protein
VWNPRFGIEYKGFKPLRLRAGYYFEPSAAQADGGGVDSVDGDKRLWSAGLTYDFGPWDVDVAYGRVSVDPREVAGSTSQSLNLRGPRTVVGNGYYESSASVLVFGVHFYPGRDREDR